ncbi:MAG: PRC-barrel domain-containing protein [Gemmatimonadaceae bacterium]
MARNYETDEGVRIAPLSTLRDFEVADGYPDIRGWSVEAADGQEVGKVHDLLVDIDNMRTRYLDVRLTLALAACPADRDVLIPVGVADMRENGDVIRVPLTAERVGLLPPWSNMRLTRAHELEVRRHFSLGEAAAEAAGAAAGAAGGGREFYDHDAYDDRRFFAARRRSAAKGALVERDTDARSELRAHEGEIRVPVERDDIVVLKRGEGGRDEIIIRRPIGETGERRR